MRDPLAAIVMSNIRVENQQIIYHSDRRTSNADSSWNLFVNDIRIIGGLNKFVFDDDCDFLIFVDSNLNKYFLNVTWNIEGLDQLINFIETRFEFELKNWSKELTDSNAVLFPNGLRGQRLYKKSVSSKINNILALTNAANGELAEHVVKYITNKTAANTA